MMIDGNMIMSGLVSKFVNDIGDKLKNKIRNADENRKSSEQNIETRIYQATIDAINDFTFDKYKGQEKLYDATESILSGFKIKNENNEVVKTGMKILGEQLSDDRCADFLGKLRHEICKDENDILYKEIVLIQNEQINEDVHEGFKRSEQNQEYIREDIYKGFERSEQNHQETQTKLDYLVEKADSKEANFYNEIRVENRTDEYAEKWDKNVFLNDFSERDENAGINVKLKDIYLEEQLPHYIWKENKKISYDLRKLLMEYVVERSGKKMLLILGQPGIGKSTLITWMMANFEEKKDDFLVYQFASDLKNVNWQSDTIFEEILKTLNLICSEMEGKILILDGFDEINTNSDRERILNRINQKLTGMNNLKNFSVVITCRENYVYELRKIECDFITLQAWDDDQIRCFCESYRKKSGSDIPTSKIDKLLENKAVFGIPIILYMVLALEITVEKSESLVDVYDQIFSIDRSSIYDRCIKDSRYGAEHRISKDEIKQAIHQISQRIAFWIFENNSEKGFIPQKEYEDICDSVIKEISNRNENIKKYFLIGNYFKLINHSDGVGTQELHFIHRSLYEYFVVVYFFESLHNLTSIEKLAGKLGELLKDGHLSEQILEFIKYVFDKIKGYNLSDVTREVFQIMLRDGMTYYFIKKQKEPLLKIIDREMNIFVNMLEVVHLWNPKLGELDARICSYLQHNHMPVLKLQAINLIGADLSRANLNGANLNGADLNGANLSRANLNGANLDGANLSRANLNGANLRGANLRGAYLNGAYLKGAYLSRAYLNGAYLIEANLRGANLNGAYLIKANLNEADLNGANLRGANLNGADLNEANLNGANLNESYLNIVNLSRANLNGANLNGAYLRGAYLSGTVLDEEQVDMLYKKCDLSDSRVFISEMGEDISYIDYCDRKKNE